jgi:hypothetical protein
MSEKTPPKPEPSSAELTALALDLIHGQSTMTLATTRDGQSWSAPVYYVFHKSAFAFFSSPKSRHIQEALEAKQAAASIFFPSSSWREIRGLQMAGVVETVKPGREAVSLIRAYLKKYPFTTEFFTQGSVLDLAAFTRQFRVNLYKFQPTQVLYMDNKIRFSFRQEVDI